jgi:Predicted membrane protein (DUF2207)
MSVWKRPASVPRLHSLALVAVFALVVPAIALAQRQMHWVRLEVAARLDAAGALTVTETHTMVFTGNWNGGERRFDVRPGQRLRLLRVSRYDSSEWKTLTEDSSLDQVDDYAWAGSQTVRWRSRRPTDPPFAGEYQRYQLHYVLTGVLDRDGDTWRLNHDFAFPDRDGRIERFSLELTFDPAWRPPADAPRDYTATQLAPGRGFVLTLPLTYVGAAPPRVARGARAEVRTGVAALLGLTALAVLWFFVREQSLGRFAPVARHVDEAWLREHILRHPAEVVGAAWDDSIGAPEVVALIARLVAEGKLESDVSGDGRSSSMRLRLKVDRSTLSGHERTLVDRLFFEDRTETSTDLVRAHYRGEGFDPAAAIRDDLQSRTDEVVPPGRAPTRFRLASLLLVVFGVAMLLVAAWMGRVGPLSLLFWALGALLVCAIGWIVGLLFRAYIQWGRLAALLCLVPALTIAAGASAWLWFFADRGAFDLPTPTLIAIVAIALALANTSINALKSRQHRAAIAFRKTLAAGRAFFASELRQDRPVLRDEWYPWILALELGREVDAWSTERFRKRFPERRRRRRYYDELTSSSSSHESTVDSTPATWTGFGGGRSGGAGGGASWAAAAGGLATGVRSVSARDSSSSSSDSSSYSSSDSGSSSSGGGGGGGW